MNKYAMRHAIVLGALLSGFCVLQCRAQNEIETDRPDITESPSVVDVGRFQIETSIQLELDQDGPDTENWFTPTLLRYGMMENLELRVETDGLSYEDVDVPGAGGSTWGYSPFEIGAKYRFHEGGETWMEPEMAVLGHIGLPTGSSVFDEDDVTGQVLLLMGWEPADNWDIEGNLGLLYDVDDQEDEFFSGFASASALYRFNDRLKAFGEIAYQGPESSEDSHGVILDTGVLYLLSDDMQVDMAIGAGIAGDETPDFFWTTGFSMRF